MIWIRFIQCTQTGPRPFRCRQKSAKIVSVNQYLWRITIRCGSRTSIRVGFTFSRRSSEKRLAKIITYQNSKIKTQKLSKKYFSFHVAPHTLSNRSIREWYLSHNPVVNLNKRGKIRTNRVHNRASNQGKRSRPAAKPCVCFPPLSSTSIFRIGWQWRNFLKDLTFARCFRPIFPTISCLKDPTDNVVIYPYGRQIVDAS